MIRSLAILCLAVGGAFAGVPVSRPAVSAFRAPLAAAPSAWGSAIHASLGAPGAAVDPAVEAILGRLQAAEAQAEPHAAVARVLTGWGYGTPDALPPEQGPQRRALLAEAASEVARQVRDRIAGWSAGELARLDARAAARELEAMGALEPFAAVFAPESLGALRQASLAAGQRQVAALVGDLRRARVRQARAIVSQLRAIGESGDAPEPVAVAAARGLVDHLPRSFGEGYGRSVVDAALWVGLSRRSPALHETIVSGLARDVQERASAVAVHDPGYELQALAAVAQASFHPQARLMARDALRGFLEPSPAAGGRLRRAWAALEAPSRGRSAVAKARVALGQSAAAGPRLPVPETPPLLPLRQRLGLERERFLRSLSWAWWRGALLGLAAVVSVPFPGLPLAVSLPALGLILAVGAIGFRRQHPIAAPLHMAAVGAFFKLALGFAAMTATPLGLLGFGFTLGMAALASALSAWSLATHRPFLGLALIAALLAVF
ncbi:MAG: hypothetical protein HY554_00830 [Elusimicrobia bacterium]|nr:hypothetical protein [Elusimicrobiota bacterium]